MSRYDRLLKGGIVIDGTAAPRFRADVAITDGRIAAVGELAHAYADEVIDVRGRIVAPGFIDVHTHDDRLLFADPSMTPKASQGVTTVITGNCGISLAPYRAPIDRPLAPPLDLLGGPGDYRYRSFGEYLDALEAAPAALNAACLVGHTTLRLATMPRTDRPASAAERSAMRAAVADALAAGAIGMSSGTFYPPAQAAPEDELIDVGAPLAAARGVFVTHMRNETDRVLDSIDETARIGRRLGVRAIISHHKVAGRANHGRSIATLAAIDRCMHAQPFGLDCYPYNASSTILSASRIDEVTRVLITWSVPHPQAAGRPLDELAAEWGISIADAVERLQPAGAIYFAMDEADVERILAYPPTMIGSDGLPHDARPHPRLWGTFPRVLGHYARERRLFSLEVAVHKMTGLPAGRFGLRQRGTIAPGAAADITVFDAATIADAATFDEPTRPAAGIEIVLVNGAPVWRAGAATGARPGRVLRRGIE